MKTKAGVAKVIGTVLSVGGALLLSFYHGKPTGLRESSIHWRYADKMERSSSPVSGASLFLGPLALIGSALVWSVWFIIQVSIVIINHLNYYNIYFSTVLSFLSRSKGYVKLNVYAWFVLSFQADISKSYPAPYTSSFYMCFMASIQCVAIALCREHRLSDWALHNHMRLISALYAVYYMFLQLLHLVHFIFIFDFLW